MKRLVLLAVVSLVAVVAVASAEGKAAAYPPDDVATVDWADDTLTGAGLRFDGAHHPVRWADCAGLGKDYPDPNGNPKSGEPSTPSIVGWVSAS